MLDVELNLPRPGALAERIRAWPRRRQVLAGALVVYGLFFATSEFDWWRPERYFDAGDNPNLGEGRSWLAGRLDLILDDITLRHCQGAPRPFDTALYNGRVYNAFPPLASILSAPVQFLCGGVPQPLLVLVCAILLPGLAYGVSLRCSPRLTDAMLMTIVYLMGTSTSRVIDQSVRMGLVYHLNHTLANIGLLLFLFEYFGQRRVWVGGLGLMAAFWARQLTLAYVLPLTWMALHPRTREHEPLGRPQAVQRLALAAVLMAATVAVPAALSAAKFGSPLESGYRYLYEGREDRFANAAQHGIFSPYFFWRNLYHMNLGLPRVGIVEGPAFVLRRFYFNPSVIASGIWWTTPLLLFLLVDFPRTWREPQLRWLLVASALVMTALLFYHTLGEWQKGYNRFSTDFIAPLLAIIACGMRESRRRLSWILAGWSVLYFQWIVPGHV